jgi:hypothetical protein
MGRENACPTPEALPITNALALSYGQIRGIGQA